jgi:hypothetical protein
MLRIVLRIVGVRVNCAATNMVFVAPETITVEIVAKKGSIPAAAVEVIQAMGIDHK